MPFTVEEFRDLIRLLEQQPEWREELRQLLLTEELLGLPQLVRELAASQREMSQNLDRLATQLDTLTARMDTLTAQMDTLTAQVGTLTTQVGTLTAQVGTLTEVQQRLVDDVGHLKADAVERRYERFAPAYFRSIILRAHTLSPDERAALVETAVDRGQLSDAEAHQLLLADLLVRGRRRDDAREVYLVVEVSWGIGHDDVDRAHERAALLARTGSEAIPVVAGDWAPHDVQEHARANHVWQVTNGHAIGPAAR
jgi:hypothetical protein